MTFSDFIRGDEKEAVMMDVMDKAKREQLRTLALAATPGEWGQVKGSFLCQTDIKAGADTLLTVYGDSGENAANAAYIAAANPATLLALLDRVDELEGAAEPAAWLVEHDDYPTGVELPDETHTPEMMEKDAAKGWRLTPLYAAPPPTERAVPEGYMKVTRELMNFLCSVGHHGAEIGDEGQPYEIGIDEVEYAQNLFTQLHDAAPGAGGGE